MLYSRIWRLNETVFTCRSKMGDIITGPSGGIELARHTSLADHLAVTTKLTVTLVYICPFCDAQGKASGFPIGAVIQNENYYNSAD